MADLGAPRTPRWPAELVGIGVGITFVGAARLLEVFARWIAGLGGERAIERVEAAEASHGHRRAYATYTTQSLTATLEAYESKYKLGTAEFLRRYASDDLPAGLERVAASSWAMFAREHERLEGARVRPLFADALAAAN